MATHSSPAEARALLTDLGELQERTRAELDQFWFPLILFGALSVLSAPFHSLLDGAGVGIFWAIAAPAGSVLTGRHYRDREVKLGIGRSGKPFMITAFALIVAAIAIGMVAGIAGADMIATIGPALVVSAAYVVFGQLVRSRLVTVSAIVLAALVVGLALTDLSPIAVGTIGSLAYGLSWLTLGLLARSHSR